MSESTIIEVSPGPSQEIAMMVRFPPGRWQVTQSTSDEGALIFIGRPFRTDSSEPKAAGDSGRKAGISRDVPAGEGDG